MRKPLVATLCGAFIAVAAYSQTASSGGMPPAALKVGVVHAERLLQESVAGKEALQRLQKMADEKREEGERMSAELSGIEQKLADQGPSLSDGVRESLQSSYQEKALALQRFQDDAARDLEGAKNEALAELEKRLTPLLAEYGKERGFSLIFNWTQANLVYADSALDVTNDVLLAFNKSVSGMTIGGSRTSTPTPRPR